MDSGENLVLLKPVVEHLPGCPCLDCGRQRYRRLKNFRRNRRLLALSNWLLIASLFLLAVSILMSAGCRPDTGELEEAVGKFRDSLAATREARPTEPAPAPTLALDPLDYPQSLRPTSTPEPTSTPPPTATARPNFLERELNNAVATRRADYRAGVGICYRTPAVQEWIISQLQIPSCAVISNAELYRITEPMGFTGLKPGDLDGLVNVESLTIGDGHCGDWENPDYAASILDGFNPEAALLIYSPFLISATRGTHAEIVIVSMHAGGVDTANRIAFSNGIPQAQADSLIKRGQALKIEVNTQARAIAEAIAEARSIERPVIRVKTLGHAVIGNPPNDGSIEVRSESVGTAVECQGE